MHNSQGFAPKAIQLLNFTRQVRWGQYLRTNTYIAIVSIFLIFLVAKSELARILLKFVILVYLMSCCLKELVDTPANWQRAKSNFATHRSFWLAAKELVPMEFRGWVNTFFKLQRACFGRTQFQPSIQKFPEAIELSYLRSGMYTSLFPIAIIACFGDIPMTQFALHLYPIEASTANFIHILSITLTVLTMTSLIGDKRLIGEGLHTIEDEMLKLRLGVRAFADIPLRDIASIEITNKKEDALFNTQLYELRVTPFDRPNLRIKLNTETSRCQANQENGSVLDLGSPRTRIDFINLYLDQPEKLINYWQEFKAKNEQKNAVTTGEN